MDFATLSARVATACFTAVGDTASYQRASGGAAIATRGALDRGYASEGHIGQRRLTANLPIIDIVSVARGDLLSIEGGTFEVMQELGRDQDSIEVLLRDRSA